MTRPSTQIALCSVMPIADADGVPEWVNLLPAGKIRTQDGRGPYNVPSMPALVAALNASAKRAIDECHSTDLAAKHGGPAPARGWIVEHEDRDGALWGRVEWTPTGAQLMGEKAYRGISPVILHDKAGNVTDVLRASLINTPNLVGLASLHSEETSMDLLEKLRELLGLGSDADEAAILAALGDKVKAGGDGDKKPDAALQSALDNPTVIALQGEITTLTGELNAIKEGNARRDATAFVDGAIAEGRVGVKPLRDEYIALHMSDPARAQKLISGMPKISGSTHASLTPPEGDAAEGAMSSTDRQVMAMFGLDEDAMKAGHAASGKKKEAL